MTINLHKYIYFLSKCLNQNSRPLLEYIFYKSKFETTIAKEEIENKSIKRESALNDNQ